MANGSKSAQGNPVVSVSETPGVPAVEKRGRRRSADKNAAIVEAAGALFLENGFDRTSMDAVAERAGVSKQTVYSHFASKDALFTAVIRAECDRHFSDHEPIVQRTWPLRDRLVAIGRQFVHLITSERPVAMFRMLVGRADIDPRQAELFYEAGPQMLAGMVRGVMAEAMAAGHMRQGDPDRATTEFAAMLKGDMHFRLSLGLTVDISAAALEAHVQRCVDTFVAAYAPSSSSAAMDSATIGDIK